MSAVDTSLADTSSTERPTIGRLAMSWAVGMSLAVVLVTLAYLVAQEVTGALLVMGAGEVTLGNVIGFTLMGGTVGAVLAYMSGRFSRQPRLVFLTVCSIALAGYAVVPFTAAVSVETALWLNLFHLLVAIPVVGMLSRALAPSHTAVRA